MPRIPARTARVVAMGAALAVAGALLVAATSSDGSLPKVKLTRVAALESATTMALRPGDDTLYVAQQTGQIRAIVGGKLATTPVLDLSARVRAGGEQGLLGVAFSPDGARVYAYYTGTSGDQMLDEYTVTGAVSVDPASRRPVLQIPDPQANHNGGQLAFGPDGFLYIASGDGGAANDEGAGHVAGGNAESLTTLLGKILRIDPTASGALPYRVPTDNPFVGVAGARPEIWAYGLRNPWRFSFDRKTGDLWIGDVGQNEWEEVDRVTAKSGGGRGVNFGWNRFEGTHTFRDGAPADAVAPVFEYSHREGCSITGGYVYRGTTLRGLAGVYLFVDYCAGKIRTLTVDGRNRGHAQNLGVGAPNVSSFGEAPNGTLYVLSQSAGVYRIDKK